MDGINKRFGPPVRSNSLGELTQLRRTGSVDEYQDHFLKLLARCANVTERQQIDIFTAGLQQPMSIDVEMQKPETLEDAMALAHERMSAVTRSSRRRPVPRDACRRGSGAAPTTQAEKFYVDNARRAGQGGCPVRSTFHAPHTEEDGATPP